MSKFLKSILQELILESTTNNTCLSEGKRKRKKKGSGMRPTCLSGFTNYNHNVSHRLTIIFPVAVCRQSITNGLCSH
ncbi:hypothetical protein MTR_7g023840 [Medicago truncatula]|uniref:Uncharacterized protein n=1 Tax=Medicago truncatula TaxID=3880 RepID=G7KVS5_MEDTR|nr:hypothetical protein MTR_7g023840 [Medicago truncatula]